MKKLISLPVLVLMLAAVFSLDCTAQSRTNRLHRPCPTSTTPAIVDVESGGDIRLRPCSGGHIYAGTTDLTTTISGLSGVTNGIVPYWNGTTFRDSNITYNSFLNTLAIRNGSVSGATFDLTTTILGDLNTLDTNVYLDSSTGQAQLYGNSTTIGAAGSEIRISHATDTLETQTGIWDLSDTVGAGWGVITFKFLRTVTAGGTTGNQTINKPAGTINIAGGSGTVTVTNSTVTANSIVFAVARTNDATCSVKNVVPVAGSFVINMNANCTAETSVGFFVTN